MEEVVEEETGRNDVVKQLKESEGVKEQSRKRGKELLKKRFGAPEMEVIPFSSSKPIPSSDDCPGITNFPTSTLDAHSPVSSDDLDIRKGTRACTKHCLSNFDSYSLLSPSFCGQTCLCFYP